MYEYVSYSAVIQQPVSHGPTTIPLSTVTLSIKITYFVYARLLLILLIPTLVNTLYMYANTFNCTNALNIDIQSHCIDGDDALKHVSSGFGGYAGPVWDAWQTQCLQWLAEQHLM